MTTQTNPLPPLPEPLCNLPAYCRDAINSYAGTAVREALAAQPRSEVDELVAEIKIRALNAASLPRDPEPRRMQLEALNACVDRLATLSASQPAQAGDVLTDALPALLEAAKHPGKAVPLPAALVDEFHKFMCDEPSAFDVLMTALTQEGSTK